MAIKTNNDVTFYLPIIINDKDQRKYENEVNIAQINALFHHKYGWP